MIPYPGDNGDIEELVRYYFSHLFTTSEICGFLMIRHDISASASTVERIKRRIGLRRRQNRSDLVLVAQKIYEVRREGHINLGYRFLWRLLNTRHHISVSQETVRHLLQMIDGEGVNLRTRHLLHRRVYFNRGPNFLVHIDGYDKLKPFGIAIHGAIDGFSRKILWLHAGPSNNNPRYIAKYFLDFIKERRCLPRAIRSDHGTENVLIRDLQMALRFNHNDDMSGLRSFLFGRSTANQRIERLWRNLSESVTNFWKNTLRDMCDAGDFSPSNPLHIECVRFCFLPLIQSQLQTFMDIWNTHRIRPQRRLEETPAGIPNVLYYQPQMYNCADYSFALPCNLQSIDALSRDYSDDMPIRGCSDDFLEFIRFLTNQPPQDTLLPRNMEKAIEIFFTLIYACDMFTHRA